ncbi:selenium metabolism-associated LysR family transcriptional regulator [Paenibacillus thermotolerans]|uniref:selenium metabolism-associated LysR family transcriptional regulator n=1 Tax=Paenibacillus thermotolerans TaxID=3027807 RepID=UPI0023681DC6|nr:MULTISPECIES: selenium metabolism-associated LysR family transcriptional regulator [unclassified Paenibacillus]
MNFKYLHTFVNVVEHQGFTEVSQAMGLTQSGVSRQIKALEEEIGLQLLSRTSSSVKPTLAGETVYRKAKQLLAEWDLLLAECHALKNEWTGQIKIGASTIPASYMLPDIVRRIREKHPKIEFAIRAEDSEDVLTMLLKRQIDLAFVGHRIEHEELTGEYVAADMLVLIGRDGHKPLSSLKDVRDVPIIVREKGSGTRRAVEEILNKSGFSLETLTVAAEVNSTEATLAMAEAGVGYAFVSHWSIRDAYRPGIRVFLEIPTDRGFYLYVHKSRHSHPLIGLFMEEALRRFKS